MPRVPIPGRAGRDQDELLLDMILDGRLLPPDAPPGIVALAANLVGLAALPGAGELPGEGAALAAFIRSGRPASTMPLAGQPSASRRRRRLAAVRLRLVAAIAVLVLGLSGTAVAAYAGVLPAAVQNFAHRVIGAPAAHGAAAHHGGLPRQHAGHPGPASPSPRSGRRAHPATPGQGNVRNARGRKGGRGKSGKPEPKPTHPVKPAHPSPKPRPSRSHGLSAR